ncbi:unnamed protein product [Closterium sp. Naga37s-1]|nr:unnamed protein product [Closterium sp. Naga37s-1]
MFQPQLHVHSMLSLLSSSSLSLNLEYFPPLPASAPPPASSSALFPGAIAGIVVAALIALIAVALLLWFLLRPSEPACKHYSLADIKQATNFFSERTTMLSTDFTQKVDDFIHQLQEVGGGLGFRF